MRRAVTVRMARMITRHPVLDSVVLAATVFILGACQRDEVREYTAPKETFPEVSAIQQQMMGENDLTKAQRESFLRFLDSVSYEQ